MLPLQESLKVCLTLRARLHTEALGAIFILISVRCSPSVTELPSVILWVGDCINTAIERFSVPNDVFVRVFIHLAPGEVDGPGR